MELFYLNKFMWENFKDILVKALLGIICVILFVILGIRWLIDKVFYLHLDEKEMERARKKWKESCMAAKWKTKGWFTEKNLPVFRIYEKTKVHGLISVTSDPYFKYRRAGLHLFITPDKDIDLEVAFSEGLLEIPIQTLSWRIRKCVRIKYDVPVVDLGINSRDQEFIAYVKEVLRHLGFGEETVQIRRVC